VRQVIRLVGALRFGRGEGRRRALPARRDWKPRVAAVAAAAAIAGALAADTWADGDPASDYLVVQNVSFPYQPASLATRAQLEQTVDSVYAQGERVKVALIYQASDLGSVPSLFGNPADYAHFLGLEIGMWYVGPLLVVMPAGFGVYDGGRSTTAEEDVLRSVSVDAASPDAFVSSATVAVQQLEAAGALDSVDVRAPLVAAHPVFARRGRLATLHFDVFDDSGRSKAIVRIYESRTLLAMRVTPMSFKIGTRSVAVRWRVPVRLRSRQLRFCVVAFDPAGNRSTPACASFLRIS
jgi:hypothetical protein